MISRLTAVAALFAVVTTASLAVGATVQQRAAQPAAAPVAAELPAIQFPRVEVTGRRIR